MYTDNIRHSDSNNSAAVSNVARKNTDNRLRVLDVDQYGYCQKCLDVIYVTEATSATSDKSTLMLRKIAKKLGAVAFFVRHEWEDADNAHPIHLAAWAPDGKLVLPIELTTWERYSKGMAWAQDMHESATQCSTTPAPYHKADYDQVWFNKNDYLVGV